MRDSPRLRSSRIDSLEAEMARVHGKLDGIASLLRDLVPLAQGQSQSHGQRRVSAAQVATSAEAVPIPIDEASAPLSGSGPGPELRGKLCI